MKFQDSIEYQVLPLPFTVLTLCGTWYSENWSDKHKRIYKLYTITILFLGVILFTECLIKIVIATRNGDFNLENIFAEIVFTVGIYKKINILYYRKKLFNFISKYTNNEWCKPQSKTEISIHVKIQSETRWVTYMYTGFIGVSILLRSVTPIIEARTFLILPLDGWYPYSVESSFAFWLTYCHQIVSGVTLTCMHLSTDTLFVGLLMQMCCQLNILKHRLSEFGRTCDCKNIKRSVIESKKLIKVIIAQRIREHESIYRFGDDLQETFKPILMGQMVVVVPSLIINVYFLSVYTDRLNSKYFTTFFFALVSLMQIYMFCWYGNEIVLGSEDVGEALYNCDWTAFNQPTKKMMLTIITRTSKTILISAVAAIPLNIDSFIKIMKTSYSAFNLLQRTAAQ